MSLKDKLILGTVAGVGAGIGSIATALMITKKCHEMMENNNKQSEEIKQQIEELKKDVEAADKAFNTYKNNIVTCNKEAKNMHEAVIDAFKKLAETGKACGQEIHQLRNSSIELIKKELIESVNRARKDIDNSKDGAINEIFNSIKDLEDKSKNAQKVVKKKQINEDDVTEKMIHQIENDNGRQTKKKRTKK